MTDDKAASAREIIGGLVQTAARIAPKYFYDARGSALFEEITRLPEYYPTRTEREIMATHAADIAQKAGAVLAAGSRGGTVIELGAGNCEKARSLCELIRPARFVAVDISAEFLHEAAAELRAGFPDIEIQVVVADMMTAFAMPPELPRQQRLVFYPGSSIGNFDPPQARGLLSRIRHLLEDDGALLIGIDLVKEVAVLEDAYNDDAGVTAAFNLNVLNHVNRLIDCDFDLSQWRHRSFYNAAESRIEMHLEAAAETRVRWPGGERSFACGERIHTENSYKYRIDDFVELLAGTGFHRMEVWSDERRWFAVILARP